MKSKGLIKYYLLASMLSAASLLGVTNVDLPGAAQNRDIARVKALAGQHVDLNSQQPDGSTALLWAAHNDDLKMAELLIGGGAHVNVANRYGISPLTEAATNGDNAMVELFLKAGADPNSSLPEGGSALMLASQTGNIAAVLALLNHGALINAQEPVTGETAIFLAVRGNQPAMVKLLIKQGAKIDAHSQTMAYPDTKDMPHHYSIPVATYPKGGMTPLIVAARDNSFESAQVLLEAGADLRQKTPDHFSALLIAVANAHWDLAALLVKKGADLNDGSLAEAVTVKDAKKIMRAASSHIESTNALDFIKLMISRGAQPDSVLAAALPPKGSQFVGGGLNSAADATALYRAAKASDLPVMSLLLEKGADVNIHLKNGSTPLMASLSSSGGGGLGTPSGPSEDEMMAAAQLCLERGADINAVDAQGQTALHLSAGRGADSLVQFLADHGAKLDLKDKRGRTPLDVANAVGGEASAFSLAPDPHPSTVALLRKLQGLADSLVHTARPEPAAEARN